MMIKSPPPASTNLAERPIPGTIISRACSRAIYFSKTLTRSCPHNRFSVFDLLSEAVQYLLSVCWRRHGRLCSPVLTQTIKGSLTDLSFLYAGSMYDEADSLLSNRNLIDSWVIGVDAMQCSGCVPVTQRFLRTLHHMASSPALYYPVSRSTYRVGTDGFDSGNLCSSIVATLILPNTRCLTS